ncbi:MAG: winged helix DNA-binding domain-containing protein [Candidatus Sulfotelmatobacter sp.]
MPKAPSPIRIEAVANFRLRRHHLSDHRAQKQDVVTICRDVCGVQAQVMSAAYLQVWTRNHAITRAEIDSALWNTRTLVKTSLMRQTLHLIPTDEFPIYIAALRPTRFAQAMRVMQRCGITRGESEALIPLIMQTLSAGPLSRPAIAAAIRPKASKQVRFWMENSWSLVRLPVAGGLICYGRGEGSEIVFIRTDHWLPKLKRERMSATEAQCALLRKYLRAYGPATLADFSHWAGIPMQEVRPLSALLESELVEIPVDKKNRLLLREDVVALNNRLPAKPSIRLLPNFDSYLLAHREKDHLLSPQHYKRVYRNQGWISPVVLIDGAIAGIWSHKLQGKRLLVNIEPFGKLSNAQRAGVEREAASLALFFDSELDLKFS